MDDMVNSLEEALEHVQEFLSGDDVEQQRDHEAAEKWAQMCDTAIDDLRTLQEEGPKVDTVLPRHPDEITSDIADKAANTCTYTAHEVVCCPT